MPIMMNLCTSKLERGMSYINVYYSSLCNDVMMCNNNNNISREYHNIYRAVACDVTSAALNQNVWQKRMVFVQEKVRFNYYVAVERRTAETTIV